MTIASERTTARAAIDLGPFVSELAQAWQRDYPAVTSTELPGTLVFADISGFTRLTERLARGGRSGAEEMSDHLDLVLSALLDAAYNHGGWLVKWGGDALLLGFDLPDHAALACAASAAMRSRMRAVGHLDTSVGKVRLRMSVGVHSGTFDFHLMGHRHRELLITGDGATVTARLEATAEAGEILISTQTAALLPPNCLGASKGDGILLARAPACSLPEPQSLPRPAYVGNMIPELVHEHLVHGGGAGEHRHVAVAFLEFSGLAALRSSRGSEAACGGLQHLVEATQDACHHNGVSFHETDISPDGGKIMLVAGAPRALDDPAEAMLCTLRQVLDDPGALTVRAGVTAGRAFTGSVGPARRRSYSVKGDVVNLAARIMGKTPPGQIWALPTVAEGSRTKFELTDVPRFTVKGKSAPVLVRAVGRPLTRVDARHDLPIVGRASELGRLQAALARARAGQGGHVDLLGPVGAGKTRLITELLVEATAADDVAMHRCAAELYRASSPYAAIRPLVRSALGLSEQDPIGLTAEVTAWCASNASELLEWLPLLGPVIGADLADTPTSQDLGPKFRAERTQSLILEILRVALPGPSLIVADDMQYADDASGAAFRHLARNVADLPWLVVLSERAEPGRSADQPATSEELVVGPLNDEAALVVVCADTDDAPLAPHLADAVVARCGGNPLFLRQLAATAQTVTDSADLPNSIETVVAARIDRLRPGARDVLRAAAVAGLSVDPDLLSDLLADPASDETPDPTSVLDQLDDFLAVDGGQLRFRQAVIRDAAYEGLPFRRRAALHGRLAALLADRQQVVDAELATVLSLHHFRAGSYAQALPLAQSAARRATAAFANAEAVLLYDRALAAAARLPEVDAVVKAELLDGLGDAQVRLGEYLASDQTYAKAMRLMHDDPLSVARISLKRARTATLRAAYDVVPRRLRRTRLVIADVPGDAAASLRLEATLCEAFTQFRRGRLNAARASYSRVIEHGSEQRDAQSIGDALAMLDVVEANLGLAVDGERSRRAFALQAECRDLAGQARVLTQIGYRSYLAGAWDDAVAAYTEAGELVERLGDLPNVAIANANTAEIRVDQGRLDEAEAALLQSIRVWRASGSHNEVAFGRVLLGRVMAKLGRYDEADVLLSEARSRFVEQGAKAEVVDAEAYQAECLLLRGRPADALALAERTLATAFRLSEQPVQASLLYRVLGAAHDALGHDAEGETAFAGALDVARRRGASHDIAFTVAAMIARAKRTGRPIDPSLIAEAVPIQRRLGLVIDLAGAEAEVTVDLPQQRDAGDEAVQVTA